MSGMENDDKRVPVKRVHWLPNDVPPGPGMVLVALGAQPSREIAGKVLPAAPGVAFWAQAVRVRDVVAQEAVQALSAADTVPKIRDAVMRLGQALFLPPYGEGYYNREIDPILRDMPLGELNELLQDAAGGEGVDIEIVEVPEALPKRPLEQWGKARVPTAEGLGSEPSIESSVTTTKGASYD